MTQNTTYRIRHSAKKADAAVLLIKAETPVTTEESGQLRFC